MTLAYSVNLYNLIIENLINAILYFYINNPLVAKTDVLPEINKIVKFGFLKVKLTKNKTQNPGESFSGGSINDV